MIITYCFASPAGDVPADDETLKRPFVAEPLQYHPFMTLGDFFDGLKDFILCKDAQPLIALLAQAWGRQVNIGDIDTIIIRYEKYGTLYQIASTDIVSGDNVSKYAVSVALTTYARKNIEEEYALIAALNSKTEVTYLPRGFCIHWSRIERDGRIEHMVMTLAEWFEGFHEWHFYKDMEGKHRIAVWAMGEGNRFISEQEAYEIIREASKILTLYYDVETSKRIFPWHHGAGDFVASIDSGRVDVKLVTVRGYERLSSSDAHGVADPQKNLLIFFLEVTTKMRMDKREGVGYTTWTDSIFVKAAVEGLFQALRIKKNRDEMGSVNVDDFVLLVQSLTQDKIVNLIQAQFGEYQKNDTSDHQVLTEHLEEHARDLVSIFQNIQS